MDGFSAAASVITVIQISSQIFDLCRTYYIEVKDARKDIQRFRNEVASLQDVLVSVADLADTPGSASLTSLNLLNKSAGPVEQCQKELEELFLALDPGQGKDKMRQFGLRALRWPFSSKDVDKALMAIGRHKATFNLALCADQTTLALAIDQGVTDLRQNFEAHQISETLGDIIRWLSMTDPSINHTAACKKHQPTTGDWFLKGPDFQIWKDTPNSLLWLYGIPGCGKTIISSTIIESLNGLYTSQHAVVVVYFYFDFNDFDKQKVHSFVSSLLAQLCSKMRQVSPELEEIYTKSNYGHHKASTGDLKKVLLKVLLRLEGTFIVIDALDECPKGDERVELLELLMEIKSSSIAGLHLLVTSRPEPDIKETLRDHLSSAQISLQGAGSDTDIKLHIETQLKTDVKLRVLPQELRVEIEKALVTGANGMFRWVFCQLESLKKCLKVSAVRNALRNLPKTLDDTYARILQQIDEEYEQDTLRALTWLAFAERPLQLSEVAEAIVVNPKGDPPFDPAERYVSPRNILHILGSLVTIEYEVTEVDSLNNRTAMSVHQQEVTISLEEEDRQRVIDGTLTITLKEKIRLAHFSVKEYLVSDRIRNGAAKAFAISPPLANYCIAESSLLYIMYHAESNLKRHNHEDLKIFPLLQYTCEYWPTHVKQLASEKQKLLEHLFMPLFLSDLIFGSWGWVMAPSWYWLLPGPGRLTMQLVYASTCGLSTVVKRILDSGASANSHLDYGNGVETTPMHEAAANGETEVIKLLLDHGAAITPNGGFRRTPLHVAAAAGHDTVCHLLLEHGADVDARDNSKPPETSLSKAVRRGYQIIVQLLLERGANIESVTMGSTPLYDAVYWQHDSVVRLLLQKQADVNVLTDDGDAPLHCAVLQGRKAMVQLLLDHGADIDRMSLFRGTPLMIAAEKGYEEIVRLLLEKRADPFKVLRDRVSYSRASNKGLTPLHGAALSGSEEIVRLLLQKGASSSALSDQRYSPLHYAALGGNEASVRLLLQAGAEVNAQSHCGETPLRMAIKGNGKKMPTKDRRKAVAKLLIGYGAV